MEYPILARLAFKNQVRSLNNDWSFDTPIINNINKGGLGDEFG